MAKQTVVFIQWNIYPATKRSELPTHATTWTNLENTGLGERGQSQKATYCMIASGQTKPQRQKAD